MQILTPEHAKTNQLFETSPFSGFFQVFFVPKKVTIRTLVLPIPSRFGFFSPEQVDRKACCERI